MVLLVSSAGEVEVRIQKPPFDADVPIFFDGYAKLGDRELGAKEYTRFIVPEALTYAIHITLKKGYSFGRHPEYWVQLFDLATKTQIYNHSFDKPCEKRKLKKDHVLQISQLEYAVIAGEGRRNVDLVFHSVSPDDNVSEGTDAMGHNPIDLGGLQIIICNCTNGELTPRDPDIYEKEMATYRQLLAGDKKGSTELDTCGQARKVDLQSYNKQGITHGVSLSGGEAEKLQVPYENTYEVDSEGEISLSFLCRNEDFFARNSIVKTPIPLECRPWGYLLEQERRSCLINLQAQDKKYTLALKIAEAGQNADTKAIRKELFETGQLPCRWRSWSTLLAREREIMFRMLQTRRIFFDRGEIPPEDRKPASPSKTAVALDDRTASIRETSGAREETPPVVRIKQEPGLAPPSSKVRSAQLEVMDLLDSPPPSPKRYSAPVVFPNQVTIKSEPTYLNDYSKRASTTENANDMGREGKRIKVEPGMSTIPYLEDLELARLKEEEKQLALELEDAERVAEMRRKRNEARARIAALEQAKRNDTPAWNQ